MRISDISYLITPEIAIDILSSLGVNIKPKRNFSLRDDDRNPSASMYIKNGKVRFHDFGTGFDGDLIDVLKEFFNLPYEEAKQLITSYLGLNKFEKIDAYKKEFKPVKEETLSYRQIKAIWDKYKPLPSLSEEKAKEVISKLIPLEYFLTAKKEDKKAFLNAVKYDPFQDEPVVATFTPAGEILTIRHRRYKVGDTIIKWKSLKATEANKYTQIRIKNNDPVFIIEGTHDYTTALLLGINFIALPSKNYKTFKDEELSLLKGKYDFVILPDLDFKNENDEKYKKFKEELQDIGIDEFKKREYRPVKDRVNGLLSFLYTLYYSFLHSVVVSEGFDPYIGFLHIKRGRHLAFVSDMMEEARIYLTKLAVEILEEVYPDGFDGLYLDYETRKIVLKKFDNFIETYENTLLKEIKEKLC